MLLREVREPQDEKGLRAFLGATGYHARFMPRYSDLVEPLRAALRADKFEWSPALSSAVQRVRDELSVHGQLLLRGDRLVVPAALRERVLTNAHAGHQGVVRTKQRLRERFWWPRLDRQVRDLLKSCEVCSQHDGHVRRERPPLQPIPLPDGPWQRLMVDVIGPMRGPSSERYGIVLVDMYSRWPEVALCQDATADSICQFLETVFAREDLSLTQLISEPTHPGQTPSLIDHIVTNDISGGLAGSVIQVHVSDHDLIAVEAPLPRIKKKPRTVTTRARAEFFSTPTSSTQMWKTLRSFALSSSKNKADVGLDEATATSFNRLFKQIIDK
ncbi:uncharacterized protein FJT64_013210 [Amphibalanus amphitrite]|uniref:RNA-directed DNA polymerase n=1 Tax=Amphibalanus amphitrite TaxID=1232801 RepID=A0A6A4V3S6_AMPAM|nr:uncharacterized protein FJT64_013210 [Amphibalanus amphitrite]